MQRGNLQSSQVDLSPKSEIFDGVAFYCDTKGVTFLGGFGGSPRKFWKIEVAKTCFPLLWAEMWPFESNYLDGLISTLS